jgi:hypothetical protein
MAVPPVYLDACVHHGLVAALQTRGFEVRSAVDEGTTDLDDESQFRYAAERAWMLVTHNERHFRALHTAFQQAGQVHAGLLILPATPPFERLVIRASMMLTWIGLQSDHRSRRYKWGQLQAMLEQGYRPTGLDEAELNLALGR